MRHAVLGAARASLLLVVAALPISALAQRQNPQPEVPVSTDLNLASSSGVSTVRHPREDRLRRGKPFHGDLRSLPQVRPEKLERPEVEEPELNPVPFPGTSSPVQGGAGVSSSAPSISAPAPAASSSFEGLDFTNWGAGHPPDTNGDVGPQYYIQTINTSVGIYSKSDGSRVTAFIFNTLMSQGNFGNLCDTANFGDPVVLYDTFEDRWIITDFAFSLSGGNVVAPEYQCFAVSKSGDPVAGGWNFYSVQVSGGFGDYPKFGIWPDGLYMSANIFGFGAGGTFQNVRVWAFNKAQMYAGASSVQVLSFDAPSAEFTLLPSNARLQTGTPPSGSPNYFSVVAQFLNVVSVYKFHVDWNSISTSTFTGPFLSITPTSWSQLLAANQTEQSPGNKLDTLYFRLMVQNQYTNIGGVESLWNSHTVGASGATSSQAAVRYYQVKVTGGTVESNATQAFTYSPDATVFRFMPSVAVDRAGDMAIGYSATNATLNPAIRYAGRLAGDAANSITQTEQSLIEGTGTQSGNCGASSCTRWGDYSAMTLDQDGCTFWYTNLYYQVTGLAFNTRIGAFSFPSCTPATNGGSLQGTVTISGSGSPISGATVALGSRTATADVNGNYSFSGLPSGTYPTLMASAPGYTSSSLTNIVINDGLPTTQDFSLTAAPTSGCLIDTTQADFQAGVPTNCDLTGSPGDVTLVNAPAIDQQNTTLGNFGVGITITTWGGQTFTPSVTGQLTRADINLFCSGCSGTTPNLTLSLRATSAGLPTGADLASTTVTGFSSGAAVFYTGTFSSPPTVTAGTQYALIIRPTANPSAGIYALTRSGTSTLGSSVYAGGTRVAGATSGTVWSIPTTGGVTTDAGFKIFMQTGFASSGTFVSSLKDANPSLSGTPQWSTLSWTADTPASTSVQFQIAASNSAAGPFNFVGPDGTGATFFSNGGSLAQFNGNRYLKYQASLSTSDSTVTPTLHDVTICFTDLTVTGLAVAPATGPFGGAVDLSATLTANSLAVVGKSVSFTLNGSPAGSGITDGSGVVTVSAVSLTGINAGSYPAAIGASFAGDSTYAASNGSGDLTVAKADQTITFGALGNKTFGDADFTVSASSTSAFTVTFGASGNCSVTGATVHITGAGSCTITASQAGDSNFNAAPDVPQSFSIAMASQTITFGALSGKTFGDADFAVSSSTTSPLTVTFGASGNCSVTGATVHITGAGSCTITASQAGDSNYNAATDVPQTFAIDKASQTVTFSGLGGKTFGDADFLVSASTTSPLTVTFGASGNCSVTGSTVHITGAGSCTITASQAGDSNYNAATDVPQAFAISKASQTITFGALGGKTFGDADFLVAASTTSPLTVSFGAGGNCSVTGTTVHITGAGSCTITASQAGNSNYDPASSVPQSFAISKASQTITFGALGDKTFGDTDFALSASITSSLTITFGAGGNCSVTGSTVHITGAGSCTITASQPGDGNYNPATSVPQSFTIDKANQSITFGALADKTFGDADFTALATASTGFPTGFRATGSCTATGSLIHLTAAGSCALTATQIGDSNYNPAPEVVQLFSIARATPIVIVSCPAIVHYDGNQHACLVSTTGIGGAAVSGSAIVTYNLSGVPPTALGVYAVNAGFVSGDPNYNNAAAAGSLTISAIAPTVLNLSPVITPASGNAFSLTVNGKDFVPEAVLSWNGSPRTTTFVSVSQITASITSADLANVGLADITIFNPGPGGGTSTAFKFAIDTSAHTPGVVTASSTSSTLTVVHGQNTTMQVTFTGANSGAQITAACYNLPAGASCSLSGNTVTITTSSVTPAGISQVIVVFTVNQQILTSGLGHQRFWFAAAFGLLGLPVGLVWARGNRKQIAQRLVLLCLGMLLLATLSGCGGHPQTIPTTVTTQQVTSQSSLAVTLTVN